MKAEGTRDLTRTVLAILFIALLMGFSLWVVKPFAGALAWAAMIAISTWPLLLKTQAKLGGKRGLAVTVLTLVLLLLFFVPFGIVVGAVVSHADDVVAFAKSLPTRPVPPPPEWLAKIPLVGQKAAQSWQ